VTEPLKKGLQDLAIFHQEMTPEEAHKDLFRREGHMFVGFEFIPGGGETVDVLWGIFQSGGNRLIRGNPIYRESNPLAFDMMKALWPSLRGLVKNTDGR